MARILRTDKNTDPVLIIGSTKVMFTADRGQMLSEEVDDAVAATVDGMPGFKVVASEPQNPPNSPPAPKKE